MDRTEFIKKTMINQPVINIGMIGHVSNGKTSIVKCITGTATQKHKDEKVRNITIRLGYANAKIYKCNTCDKPECYQSTSSDIMTHRCTICDTDTELVMHVSFTDVPGHNVLMTTMMNGTCVMDYAILVESGANMIIPAPQTMEHFQITKEAKIVTKLICLNKMDLLIKNKDKAHEIMSILREFVENDKIPIIPVSGTMNYNIDVLCEYIANMKVLEKYIDEDVKMLIIRSFNINSAKTKISEIKGGVVGGSLMRGTLKLEDDVMIYPGFISKKIVEIDDEDTEGKKSAEVWLYKPLKCKVLSINSDKNSLKYAISGGLIGVQLNIDPAMTRDDELAGQVLAKFGSTNMRVFQGLTIKFTKSMAHDKEDNEIKKGLNVFINVNSNNINCNVREISGEHLYLNLDKPVCVEIGDKITVGLPRDGEGITSEGEKNIFILGYGLVIDGVKCDVY